MKMYKYLESDTLKNRHEINDTFNNKMIKKSYCQSLLQIKTKEYLKTHRE